ncbi:hypothetical protein [Nocardia brevicatena]|uniref:hypothetical protein n=1 Tax=Nocardia brevicatena TaxID=37327 RepID=UPI00031A9AEB|nr:hypothetical protein [Nocardia brevicatena]
MTGEGEGSNSGSDKADFGPPTGEFGPPVSDFGPPTGELPVPGWQPESAPENSELTWRPAMESAPSPSVPAPAPQFRAPDSGTPEMSRPVFRPAPDAFGPELSVPVSRPVPESTFGPELSSPVFRPAPREQDADTTVRHPIDRDTRWSPSSADTSASSTERSGSAESHSPSGLSWDNDPIAQQLTPQSVASALTPAKRRTSTGNRLVLIAAVVVAVFAVAAGVWALIRGTGTDSTAAPAPPAGGATLDCPATQDGKMTTGNGPGDTASGAGAILGFQHAYYSDRDATLAHTFAASGANLLAPAELQKAIDEQIPQGTTYCLRIVETAPDHFNVEITELRPDGTRLVYWQGVTTVNRDGRTLIQLIDPYE